MAGHSKWANIKHRKQGQDAKRGKQFAKLIRVVESAAREAQSSDPAMSASLALAIQRAKDADLPKDTYERAAKRGAGELDGAKVFEVGQYEGYSAGGVAVLVDILTDNKNRTASAVRNAFSKTGGSIAEPGSVAFMFSRRGQVVVKAGGNTADDVMMMGIDAGLEDLDVEDDVMTAWCDPSDAPALRGALEAEGLTILEAGSTMVPSVNVPIEDVKDARNILRLIDLLEDDDDVQEVYANFDMSDDLLEEASAQD